MSSTRAQDVAEALWELKRADKLATFSAIARRAGFSAGSGGRAMKTCMKRIRRDWPHLEWWRAIEDSQTVEKGSDHEAQLREHGLEISDDGDNGRVAVDWPEDAQMDWDSEAKQEAAV